MINRLGLVAASATIWSSFVLADVRTNYDGFDHHMSWGAGLFGGLGMLLFWGLLIATVVIAVRYALGGSHNSGSKRAIDILNERFARGEIDEEEYRRRKQLLE